MIHRIKVKPNTTASDILFFDEIDLDSLPDPRIVPLFGANGSGKTTLLLELEKYLKTKGNEDAYLCNYDDDSSIDCFLQTIELSKRKLPNRLSYVDCTEDSDKMSFYIYRNSKDNFKNKRSVSFNPYVINLALDASKLSEGQSIVYSIEDLFRGMLKSTKKRESFVADDEHVVLLLDEIDSGLSLDNIEKLMRLIKKVLKEGRNIQFFLSFNNPYIVHFFPYVISMYDGKVHEIHISDFAKELRANKKMLDKARKTSNGRYRIYE